jgi:hypothetical protein
MTRVSFDGDPRSYCRSKPSPQSRFYVHCQATEERDGVISQCTFHQREDDFRRNITQAIFHKCTFGPRLSQQGRQLRIETFQTFHRRRSDEITPIIRGVAVLTATANLSAKSVCSGDLHALLISAYLTGWRESLIHDPDRRNDICAREAANRAIPRFSSAMMTHALDIVYREQRSELIAIFKEYPYVGLSIDGVTIRSRKFLNVDVVNPVSSTLPFTYDFLENTTFTAIQFGDLLANILNKMQDENLRVAGVTADACPFQRKALSWYNSESLQQRHAEFRKLLFIPCICHRLQNSMVHLYQQNENYRRIIGQVREAAVLLRKPMNRDVLHATCPMHCATRWIYDYPLLGFITDHLEVATDLLGRSQFELDPQFINLLPLLEKVFLVVRSLEADDASVCGVYSRIEELLRSLSRCADAMECEFMHDLYIECISIIRELTLNTTNYVFQLAHVLTPAGRNQARDEMLQIATGEMPTEVSDDERFDHVAFINETDHSSSESDEEDVLRVGSSTDPPVIARLTATPVRDASGLDHSSASDPSARELGAPDETSEIGAEVLEDQDPPSDEPRQHADDTLCAQAEAGLKEIIDQWNIDEDLADRTLGTFQGYVVSAPADLQMRPIPDTKRYPWGVRSGSGAHWALLSDIAVRLQALVCNEAVSERTNGTMRRLLAPFRMKMKREVLLSRLTIAKHGTIEPERSRD